MSLSPNRRIAVNFAATYGRSLFVIVVGLFCGRWTLMALGDVDYGLYGLVGGLTAFIMFFNSLMATSVGRFFAYSVGQAQVHGAEGLEECRKWFNVASFIHFVVPVILVVLGYPLGQWAIRDFLTIPLERVDDCLWVWRFVCISCFLSMVTVPFNAMYTAKQYIAELTIYTFFTTSFNAVFLYYMVSHPGVWLVRLALWTCFLGILPQIIIAVRALWIFPECKFIPKYMFNPGKMKEVGVYAFYRFFGALGILINSQGLSILVNKLLGPARNAAMNVGATVSGHSNSLSGSFLSALSPAITNAYGAGDMERVRILSFAACRLTTVMVLIFALPLSIEADEVFKLWLKIPPEGCVTVCLGLLFVLVVENMSCGHYIAIFAEGSIKWYQIFCLSSYICALPIAWFLMSKGMGLVSIAYALAAKQLLILAVRLFFGRRICKFSVMKWVSGVFVPIVVCSLVAITCGLLPRLNLEASFQRVVITTIVINSVFLPFVWFWVLGERERDLLKTRVLAKIKISRRKQ